MGSKCYIIITTRRTAVHVNKPTRFTENCHGRWWLLVMKADGRKRTVWGLNWRCDSGRQLKKWITARPSFDEFGLCYCTLFKSRGDIHVALYIFCEHGLPLIWQNHCFPAVLTSTASVWIFESDAYETCMSHYHHRSHLEERRKLQLIKAPAQTSASFFKFFVGLCSTQSITRIRA